MPINFSCTVKSIMFGLSAFSAEIWDNNQANSLTNPYGWVSTLAYLDGSGYLFSELENTNFGDFTTPGKDTLYNYTFATQPNALAEDENTNTLYVDSQDIYIPSSYINAADGNQWLVFVCNVVTVDKDAFYTTSDNLGVQNFAGSQATIIGGASSIIAGSISSYTSNAFSTGSSLSQGNVANAFDTATGIKIPSAYIGFAFPIQADGSDDASIDIVININGIG